VQLPDCFVSVYCFTCLLCCISDYAFGDAKNTLLSEEINLFREIRRLNKVMIARQLGAMQLLEKEVKHCKFLNLCDTFTFVN